MPTKTNKILWFSFNDGAEIWIVDGKLVLEEV